LRRIGSVQYDPLNVVGRNTDLVFQSRVKNYKADLLNDLLYSERSLTDGWDKEMSVYLTNDIPFFSRITEGRLRNSARVLEHRGQTGTLQWLDQVIGEIKTRGPLMAREIKLGACEGGSWGHRQISGAALDYLLTAGKLGVHSKKNAHKVYDLTENLLPAKILNAKDPFGNEDEFYEWYIMRRIGSMGVHWLRNGSGWLGYGLGNINLRQKIFALLEEKKLIVPLHAAGINETFYIRRKDLPIINDPDQYDGAARIMAPLDNMLWDRLMVKKLFDFEYTWEVYVPQVKRKYGYYVLPVLYKNNLIARFEPVKYEQGQPIKIKAWWWEDSQNGKKINKESRREQREAVIKGLQNFAVYLGADGVDRKSLRLL